MINCPANSSHRELYIRTLFSYLLCSLTFKNWQDTLAVIFNDSERDFIATRKDWAFVGWILPLSGVTSISITFAILYLLHRYPITSLLDSLNIIIILFTLECVGISGTTMWSKEKYTGNSGIEKWSDCGTLPGKNLVLIITSDSASMDKFVKLSPSFNGRFTWNRKTF